MNKDSINRILSAVLFIIALLTFGFGEGVIKNYFFNPDLVMETKIINEYLPTDIKQVMGESPKKDNLNKFNSLRIINIKNEGNSTKEPRISLKLDGHIHSYETESSEVINEESIESDSTIVLSMDRLSNDSTLDLKVWLINEGKSFSGSYTDNISKKEIPEKSNKQIIYITITYTASAILLIVSIIWFITTLIKKKRLEREKRKDEEQQEFIENKINGLFESFADEINQNKESIKDYTKDTAESKERLKAYTTKGVKK